MIVSNLSNYERFSKMAQYTSDELDTMLNIENAPGWGDLSSDHQQELSDLWTLLRQAADRAIAITPDDDPQSREGVDSLHQAAMHFAAASLGRQLPSEAEERALHRSFDGTNKLNVTVVAGTSTANSNALRLSENGIWRRVFDDTTQTIRVVRV